MWNPNLFLENALGDVEPDCVMCVERDSDGCTFIVKQITTESTFSETLELQSFPFDIQVSDRTVFD